MKKYLDVNKQRKIKNKILTKKYLSIFVLFLSFFLIMFAVWQLSLKDVFFGKNSENFPILFSGDSVLGFEKTKNGFCILTNNQFSFYNKNGIVSKNITNRNSKTKINVCQDNVLIYEKSAKNYSVQTDKKLKFFGNLEQNIIFGKIFKNGSFAFVTSSEKYFCEFVVFNNKNKQIFSWSCAQSLIVDFDVFDDGNGCVIATTGVQEGFSKATIHSLKFSNDKEKLKKDFEKFVPFSVKKIGSNIILVCDSKVFFINERGRILKSYSYLSDLKNYVITDDGFFIVCFNALENSKFSDIIMCYDRSGNLVSQTSLEENVILIKAFSSKVVVLTDSSIILTNEKLKFLKKAENCDNVEDFIYLHPYIYFVSTNKIDRVKLNSKE